MALYRLLPLVLIASPVLAQELTPEARASVYGKQWMTFRGYARTHGDLYQGDEQVLGAGRRNNIIDGGGEWVEAFSLVPQAHELAMSARTLQRVHLTTFWSSMGIITALGGAFLGVYVAARPSLGTPPVFAPMISIAALYTGLQIVSLVTGYMWPRRLAAAVHEYNIGLNETLPVDQRFDFGT